jgi:protein-L-isoaspartate(D-aspartate) O-methyltransferase
LHQPDTVLLLLIWIAVPYPPYGNEGDMSAILVIFTQALILDLFPGARVLEVGTGTGYNVALLSEVVGEQGHVTSIDIDHDLVQVASQRLKDAGYTNVRVKQADALEAIPDGIYDRILLTGGYPTILPTWIEYLTNGGKLVGNLLGMLATPLFCLIKQDNEIQGNLLPTPAFFMSLYRSSDTNKDTIAPGARVSLSPYLAMPIIEVGHTTTFVEALDDLSFRLFLDVHLPGVQMRPHYLGGLSFATYLVYTQSLAMFSPANDAYSIEVRGSFPLWSRLQELHSQWSVLRPPINCYSIIFDRGRCTITLSSLVQKQ